MLRKTTIGFMGFIVLLTALCACGNDAPTKAPPLEAAEVTKLVKEARGADREKALEKLREGIDATNLPALDKAVNAARANVEELKTLVKRVAMLKPGDPRNAKASRDAARMELCVRRLESLVAELKKRPAA